MFERILVPLDGSPTAEAVLPQVRSLFAPKGTEIVLLSVVTIPVSADLTPVLSVVELKDEATRYLRTMEERLRREGLRVRTVLEVGLPAETILDVADEQKSGLIAMSTHGYTGISRWAFGSVSEKVLRGSRTPLLMLRSFAPASNGGHDPVPARELPLKRILVPVDVTDLSLGILPYAKTLASLFGADIFLLHVLTGRDETEERKKADLQIEKAIRECGKAGLRCEVYYRKGEPALEVLDACRSSGADLIAMSTHGRSTVSRWMLGSVTEKVLRTSTVPMLLVRTSQTPCTS